MRLLSFPLAILMASQTLVVRRYDCSVLSPTINPSLSPRCREELLAYAEDVGLDVGAFAEDMDSRQTKARIKQDVSWGRQIGVSSTPTVYLNGRRVDKKMRTSLLFWSSRAKALKDSREARNQDW